MPGKKNKDEKNKKRKWPIILIVIVIIIILLLLLFRGCPANEPTNSKTTEPSTSGPAVPGGKMNPLTGIYGFNEEAVGKRPYAVVVQNARPARPQWGMCSPDILIEGMTEGGITRMLWLYADVKDIPKVGPVRSARHDFVEMAEGLDAIFVHWGYSIYARKAIEERKVDSLNGIKVSGKYFKRDSDRRHLGIEHAGYTDGEMIYAGISRYSFRKDINSAYTSPFSFVVPGYEKTFSGGKCAKISFSYSGNFNYSYTYNPDTKLYYAQINNGDFLEDGGKQLSFTGLLILYCGVTSMGDAAGCVDMDLEGGGQGLYISNNSYEEISWTKGGPSDMLKLFDSEGKELLLNPGKSYIGFVPDSRKAHTAIFETVQ